jgi:PAS domain S-box-containing protein
MFRLNGLGISFKKGHPDAPGPVHMKILNFSPISRKLMLMILFAVMPCLAILLYSGIELRRHLIEDAQSSILAMTHNMALAQKEITQATRQTLSTLSLLPPIQAADPNASSTLLRAVLDQNTNFNNLALLDLKGNVLASGKPFTETNLADRRHVKGVLRKNDFAAGEYIITRVGNANPSFAFAYPVLDKNGRPRGILTAAIKLDIFLNFYDASTLPGKSFLAVTDQKGIRIFYHPAQNRTNPVGEPIQAGVWDIATKGDAHGLFFGTGSDGLRRIFAYEKVLLKNEETPYLYVWAGIPEDYILKPANQSLIRNLLLMLLTTVASLFISWVIGKNTLVSPIQRLITLTRNFARGDLDDRSELTAKAGEVGVLTEAFHDMAEALTISRRTLQESEQRFRTIADFAYDWEYWIDPDGHFIYLSPSCERITGYSPKEIISDPQIVVKMVKPEYAEKVHHIYFGKDPEDGSIFSMEFPVFTKSGKEVWLENNCRQVYDDQGNYAGRRGSNRDITDRKHAHEKLRKSEEKFKAVFHTSPDAINLNRVEDGKYIDINEGFTKIMGYSREEIMGKFSIERDIWHDPKDRNRLIKGLKQNGVVENLEAEFIGKDGQIKTGLTSARRINIDNQNCILSITRDLTEKKVMEATLQQAQKMESIGTLAGGIAHDFNNILSGIFGFSQLAKRHINDSETAKKDIDQIIKGAQKATELVQQILTVSRKSTPEKTPISVYSIVKDALKLLRAIIPATIEIKEDIAANATVMGDSTQIHQIVMNLCTNAYHAMIGTGGCMSVDLKEIEISQKTGIPGLNALPGRYLSLEVSDTGHGMDSAIVKKIFDPYFTTKDAGKGTGLGLAVVFSIVEEHKGYIRVHSEPGKGSTFYVYLPIIDDPPSCAIPVKDKEGLLSGSETIMFVDDEEALREVVNDILKALGYRVCLFSNGTRAFEVYQEDPFQFDLVMTDMTMPGITGFEMSQKMLELRPDQPVILCTGYSESINRERAISMGVTEYVEKPFIINELANVIRTVLDDANNKRQAAKQVTRQYP